MLKVTAHWEDWRPEDGIIYAASRPPRGGNGGIAAIASALERFAPNTVFVHRGQRERDGVPHVMVTCGGKTYPDEEVGRLDQTALDEARLLAINLLWFGLHGDWENCDEFIAFQAWENARLDPDINPVGRRNLMEKAAHATTSHERRWEALNQVCSVVAAVIYKLFKEKPRPILINDGDNSLVPKFLIEMDPAIAEWILYMHHVPVPDPRRMPPFYSKYFQGTVQGALSKGIRFFGLHTPRDRKHLGQMADELGGEYVFEEAVMQITHSSGRVTRLGQTFAGVDSKFFQEQGTPSKECPPIDLVEMVKELVQADQTRLAELADCGWLNDIPYVAKTDRMDDREKNGRRFVQMVDRVFTDNPKQKGKFYFLVIGDPSRSQYGLPVYDDYLANCHRLINEVNKKHKQGSWRPIIWLKAVLPPAKIAKIYGHPHCLGAFVGSKADGLHLGGFEWTKANAWKLDGTNFPFRWDETTATWLPDPDVRHAPGVLWLSDGTGAYVYLGHHGAVYINPRDVGQMARAVLLGINMSPEERQFRLEQLQSATGQFDLHHQLERILKHAGLPVPPSDAIDPHNGVLHLSGQNEHEGVNH